MKTIRIYQEGHYEVGEIFSLDEAQSHHVAGVLHLKERDALVLFRGDHHEFIVEITEIKKREVKVLVLSKKRVDIESFRSIHLAQALVKGDRMEWVIQKAVELGVKRVTPLITARSVVKLDDKRMDKKLAQWQAIAVSACEQSGRNWVPQILQPQKFQDFVLQHQATYRFILDPYTGKNWRQFQFDAGDIALLIGPEGGLTEAEVLEAKKNGFEALSLGPRILRTETAAITALGLLQAVAGDL